MRKRAEHYQDVPPAQRERLSTFPATYPYRQLTLDGTTWRYIACGEGDSTLLFLPGAFLEAEMWFNQILTLEEHYRILAPDAYALQGVFDLDCICDALVGSLDAEGIERATVIGISAGGGVAQVLLQSYPDRVEHVVFSHCGVLEHDAQVERKTRRILWLVRLLPSFLIRRVLKRMTTGDIPRSSEWTAFHEAFIEKAVQNVDKGTVLRFLRSGLETRRKFTFAPQSLKSWPGSILILSSKDDALSCETVDQLRARYPRAKTEILAEGGHHAFLFFPQA